MVDMWSAKYIKSRAVLLSELLLQIGKTTYVSTDYGGIDPVHSQTFVYYQRPIL